MIGVAMAPNATGAVFAVSASTAAFIGLKPSAINITDVTATGVPKPASASINAPKENAMMMAWTRWSSLTLAKERRSTSKCPVSTVIWYTQIALMTIHRMGKKPNAAPSVPASSACPTGMPYTAMATTRDTASEINDATHAVILSAPSRTNSNSSGTAATRALQASELAIGSRTCWYMVRPRLWRRSQSLGATHITAGCKHGGWC